MSFHKLSVLSAYIILSTCAGTAQSDVIFGTNARAVAMGGAGLAIVDRSEYNTLVNPAALALYNRRVKLSYPGIGIHISGISFKAAADHLFGNPDKNDAVTLAKDFGSRPSEFGIGLSEGLRVAHMDVTLTGIATARVIPNAAMQTWAKNANGDITQLTGSERADLLGAGIYSLPSIGVAERISPNGSPIRFDAGFRIKLSRAVYSHYIVNSDNIRFNTAASSAPELNGGTTLTKDGIGGDIGFLVHPRSHAGWSAALVVFNAVEPNFAFIGTDSTGAPAKYALQPRSVSVGTAYESGRVVVAADAIDLTAAYNHVQGRIGVEYATKRIGLRAGYASARGFTVGFGWGFLQLAFGARAPLEIIQTLHF